MSYCTDKLMIDGQTHAHTHTHTQATTIPEGQNWPRVKNYLNSSDMSDKIPQHYSVVIMSTMEFPITCVLIVYSAVCSDTDQRKHQSSTSQAFVWGIHRWPVNSPHKWPVTRKVLPFDDVIMISSNICGVEMQEYSNQHLLSLLSGLICHQLYFFTLNAS